MEELVKFQKRLINIVTLCTKNYEKHSFNRHYSLDHLKLCLVKAEYENEMLIRDAIELYPLLESINERDISEKEGELNILKEKLKILEEESSKLESELVKIDLSSSFAEWSFAKEQVTDMLNILREKKKIRLKEKDSHLFLYKKKG